MVTCPYCGDKAELLTSLEFYGRDYGSNVYSCKPCDAYVGTHKGTKQPLGTLAQYELRELRKKAHAHFDPLWKSKEMSRTEAYAWLKEELELENGQAHIGMFDEDQCKKLIKKVKGRELW